MISVTCPIEGTYLVRDQSVLIPVGKTATDVSTVVYRYEFGWVCGTDGFAGDPEINTRPRCEHIQAAQEATI